MSDQPIIDKICEAVEEKLIAPATPATQTLMNKEHVPMFHKRLLNTTPDLPTMEQYTLELPDDMSFPKASVNAKLLRLQKEVTEFITSVILKHERELYDLFKKQMPQLLEDTLGLTTNKIITIIQLMTMKFYNSTYKKVQDRLNDPVVKLIEEMVTFAEYGPHILLDRLCRLTFHIHLDIARENLDVTTIEIYEKCLLKEINTSILSMNLLHVLSKSENDDVQFQNVPDNYEPFKIIIDKNIEI